MDMQSEPEFQFLDLDGLNDNDIDDIKELLKTNVTTDVLKLPWDIGENECTFNSMEDNVMQWQYPIPPYEQQMYVNVPMTQAYPPSILYSNDPMCMTNMYQMASVNNAVATGSYVYYNGQSVMYQPVPPVSGDFEAQPKENPRRNGRMKNMKNMGYLTEQPPPYQIPGPVYYPHSMQTQQPVMPPVTGSYSPQTNYTQNYHHPHQTMHQTYSNTVYNHSPTKYNRQVQSSHSMPTQVNHEPHVNRQSNKIHEKRPTVSHTNPKPFQAEDDGGSSQTSINCTLIVNNKVNKPSEAKTEEDSTSYKSSHNSSSKSPAVNVKIEQNIVSTMNENCGKTDIPLVSINSSIEVKQQNGEVSKESVVEQETVSSITTTVVNTTSTTTPVTQEKPTNGVVTTEEKVSEPTTPVVVPVPVPTPAVEEVAVTTAAAKSPVEVASPPNMSWASIVKTNSTDPPAVPNRPVARVNPQNAEPTTIATAAEPKVMSSKPCQPTQIGPPKSEPFKSLTPDHTSTNNVNNQTNEKPLNHIEQTIDRCDDVNNYRMGELLKTYQMEKQTVSLLPRGLTNRSNYCYINSILQALLACPPFYNLLMKLPRPQTPAKHSSIPLINNMCKFVREFQHLADAARLPRKDRPHKKNEDSVMDIQSGAAFEPTYVYTMLKSASCAGIFSVEGRQEDAEEFLSCLLNGISDEMLELIKHVSKDKDSVNDEDDTQSVNSPGQEEWKVMGPKNKGSITRCTEFGKTPLSDIFRGQLRSRVSRAGEQPTDNVQPFFTLQLDIEKAESVKTALDILANKDQLEGMMCSKTKQSIEAWKQVYLEELPVILVLHLKWFDYKLDGCSKILKSVEFPIDLKIDSKLLSPNASKKFTGKQKQYKLFAVTYHDGKEATKGHYVTDAFHVGFGGWVRYDDSSVKSVSEGSVLNPQPPRVPYLLYYRRSDTIGPNQPNNRAR